MRSPLVHAALAALAASLVGLRYLPATSAIPDTRPPTPARQVSPRPDPHHSPEQVIGFQLAALRDNDVPARDAGIATVFSFSSPANRVATGPLARFAELVKSSAYRPLLGHLRAARGTMRLAGDEAEQEVTITVATGGQASYLFTLSRQPAGAPYAGCWMTDGVVRLPDVERPAVVRRAAVADLMLRHSGSRLDRVTGDE